MVITSILKNKLCKHLKGRVLGWVWESEPIFIHVSSSVCVYIY